MSVDVAVFKIRFPEFESIADPRIQIFIDDAVAELEPSGWGDRYDVAICYLAAHYLALGQETAKGNTSGLSPVASSGADGLSIGFAKATYTSTSQEYWQSTSYGKEFMRIKKTIFPGMKVASCNDEPTCP